MTKKEMKDIIELLKEQARQQASISNSLDGYIEGLKQAKALNETIARNKKIEADIEAKALKARTEAAAAVKKGNHALAKSLTDEAKKQDDILQILKSQTKELDDQSKALEANLKTVNKGNLLMARLGSTALKAFAAIPSRIKKEYAELKGTGVFDMDKSIKRTALSMGLLTTQTNSFSADIRNAAKETLSIGAGIEELAQMQSDYSNEIGRTVMLGVSGAKAMADMAKATGLGAEGAAKMAADMEQQGLSAERTKDFIEATMTDSSKMGLNASKVVKTIQQNIKMLNKYNFKGGLAGLKKMAETVTKLGIDMTAIAPMADKLFDIEGAVDMSAQLQVLGGTWAKMADPFHLMFMARNDMAGLTEEIGQAAAASVTFNKKAGDFEISSLEMHRLRKIAEQTGIAYEDLAQAGKNARKQTEVKSQIRFNIDKETQEFLANTAKFTENGQAYIDINGSPKLLKDLTQSDDTLLKAQISEKKTLNERAKAARTFDEALSNTFNLFKTTLLPLIDTVNSLIPKLDNFVKRIKDGKWIETAGAVIKSVGGLVASLAGWVIDNPIKSAFIFGATQIAGFLMAKAGWILNGLALAQGFNIGVGKGGFLKNILTKFGGGGKGDVEATPYGRGGKVGFGASEGEEGLAKGGKSMFSKVGGSAMGGLATGAINAIGADSVSEGVGNVAGGVIGGILGSFLDPFIGPLGTMIGAQLGSMAGGWIGNKVHGGDTSNNDDGIHDGVIHSNRNGFSKGRGVIQNNRVTPIDDKDDLLAMKKGGTIDKTIGENDSQNKNITQQIIDHLNRVKFNDSIFNGVNFKDAFEAAPVKQIDSKPTEDNYGLLTRAKFTDAIFTGVNFKDAITNTPEKSVEPRKEDDTYTLLSKTKFSDAIFTGSNFKDILNSLSNQPIEPIKLENPEPDKKKLLEDKFDFNNSTFNSSIFKDLSPVEQAKPVDKTKLINDQLNSFGDKIKFTEAIFTNTVFNGMFDRQPTIKPDTTDSDTSKKIDLLNNTLKANTDWIGKELTDIFEQYSMKSAGFKDDFMSMKKKSNELSDGLTDKLNTNKTNFSDATLINTNFKDLLNENPGNSDGNKDSLISKKKRENNSGGLLDELINAPTYTNAEFSNAMFKDIIQNGAPQVIDNKASLMKPTPTIVEVPTVQTKIPESIKHEFGDITINGNITVSTPGGGTVSVDLLQDPQFIRSITRMIHAETDKNINGGKIKG